MRTMRTMLLVGILSLLTAFMIGCGEDAETTIAGTADVGIDDYAEIDFDAEYGGLTTSDEEPAFADTYLLQDDAAAADEVFVDEWASDPEVLECEEAGRHQGAPNDPERPRFTFVRMVWGDLDGPVGEDGVVEDGDVMDWTGTLTVDRGTVVVRRVIRFERPFDSVVHPRLDRHTVAWISHTGGHYDGLVIEIIEPPHNGQGPGNGSGEGTVEPETPNVLHFTTPAFTQDFVVDELAGLDEVFEVEPAGNAIHFVGFNLSDLDDCPKGFLSGIWQDDPETDDGSGTFRGRWSGLHGRIQGHMMGSYGYNEAGEPVFFGKYIRCNGSFAGLLEGTWAPDDEDGHGTFEGVWVGETEDVEGVLGGRYYDRPECPGGFYQGRWATDCDDEAVEEIQQ